MCFNAAKLWYSGWYPDLHAQYDARVDDVYVGEFVGIDDVVKKNTGPGQNLLLKIIPVDNSKGIYLLFNRKTGINSGVDKGDEIVLVSSTSGSLFRAKSVVEKSLREGGKYTVLGVVVKVCSIELGSPSRAKVMVYKKNTPAPDCNAIPTKKPSNKLTGQPTKRPTRGPTKRPTKRPSNKTSQPTKHPTNHNCDCALSKKNRWTCCSGSWFNQCGGPGSNKPHTWDEGLAACKYAEFENCECKENKKGVPTCCKGSWKGRCTDTGKESLTFPFTWTEGLVACSGLSSAVARTVSETVDLSQNSSAADLCKVLYPDAVTPQVSGNTNPPTTAGAIAPTPAKVNAQLSGSGDPCLCGPLFVVSFAVLLVFN
jgi:hypothetical protein